MSGTCSECINGNRRTISPEDVEKKRVDKERTILVNENLLRWAEIKVPAQAKDIGTVQSMAQAFALPHLGDVPISMLWVGGPIHGIFYKVKCHPSDVAMFHHATQKLYDVGRHFDPSVFTDRLKQFDPPALPFPTVDDISK
jgi:hypothetical protein